MTTQAVGNPPATNPSINAPADATFKIDDAKVYVPTMMLKYVTFSTQDDNRLLQQLKTGFKRAVRWNK